jgi:HEAT repeat protein
MRLYMSALGAAMLFARPGSSLQAGAPQAASPAHAKPASASAKESEDFLQSLQRKALPGLIQSITEKKTTKRLRVTEMVGDVQGSEASPYLLQSYNETTDEGVRCTLLESMGKFHDPALLGWFIQRLGDPSIKIQSFAIWALGELRLPQAVEPLRKKLWSPNRFVQMTAIDALGKTGRNRQVAAEVAVFIDHDDVQVRYLAAKALGGLSGPDGIPALFARLDAEPSLEVQEVLAQAIGHIGGPVAIGHLIELLKYPPSPATEHWAEVGLVSADPVAVRAALRPLADGNDFSLKIIATRLLKQFDDQRGDPVTLQ